MIYRSHYIELFVNGERVEFKSQKDVNIRFNSVLQDPTKITYTQAEYSFSFTLPCTPTNNKIFDYANNLSKLNKFRTRYDAELHADGSIIFKGSLTISSIKNKEYNVNLVSIKNYSLDEIFGETTMDKIRPMKRDSSGGIMLDDNGKPLHTNWEIPFDGAPMINAINFEGNPEVMFPLISYGAFAKKKVPEGVTLPDTRPVSYDEYTSKFDLDSFNEWYVESFYPSHNMLATLKNAFETKDYVVQGDVFQNQWLKDIYMSVNLADEQVPTYNLANPKFGKADLSVRWVCPQDRPSGGYGDSGETYGTTSTLKFPTLPTARPLLITGGETDSQMVKYNCEQVRVYDMLLQEDGGSATTTSNNYLYQDDEGLIVIPSDGFYRISMEVSAQLNQTANVTATQWIRDYESQAYPHQSSLTFAPDFKISTPLEIQLVRNWVKSDDEGIELIKGRNGIVIYTNQGHLINPVGPLFGDYEEFFNSYPHERIGSVLYLDQPTSSIEPLIGESIQNRNLATGAYPPSGEIMAFDPFVSDKFICGFSSWGNTTSGGTGAVIKNGRSWTSTGADRKNQSFYNCNGYISTLSPQYTNLNKNLYVGAQYNFNQTATAMTGTLQCMVWLNRNDVLRLVAVHRDYETDGENASKVSYATSANVNLTIEAATPKDATDIRTRMEKGEYNYSTPSEFELNLNLANFFNKETKISDWVKNIQEAFNLEIVQFNKTVTINVKKKPSIKPSAVNLDDRVNSDAAEVKQINYPKSMAVKYKIDEDEWGAEVSAIETYGNDSIMNTDDWKNYIDRGYTEIMLNDDSFVTSTSEKSLKFSYTWYDWFEWFKDNTESEGVQFKIPVISKYSYMIDGFDYEESRKHDGYGLAQRFWFKPELLSEDIDLPIKDMDESVKVYIPKNYKDNFNLSYKVTEKSILGEFFNISSYLASNYVKIDVYLNPSEYNRLKNGAYAQIDSDLYYVVEISGFDPSGYNAATLTLLKKVV